MKQTSNAIALWKDINYYQRLIYEYDFETYTHCQKVAQLSSLIAMVMGTDHKEISSIYCGALIHDLGKIRLSRDVLHKKTVLNEAEWDIVKQHPRMGLKLFESVHDAGDAIIKNIILYHHERIDGGGYPFGLTGNGIPLEARIVSIADALDAMITYRCYRDGVKDLSRALAELVDKGGSQFDEHIVNRVKLSLNDGKIELGRGFSDVKYNYR